MDELLAKRIASLSLCQTEFIRDNQHHSELKIAYFIGSTLDGKDIKWKKFVEKLKDNFSIVQVTGEMIINNCLIDDGFDVLFMPGGYPSEHYKLIGEETGMKKVKEFLSLPKKGYVGSCAGAYCALAQSSIDGFKNLEEFVPKTLDLLEGVIIKDRENHIWKRGFGTSKVTLTELGQKIFNDSRSEVNMFFRNGPILHVTDPSTCQVLATYSCEFMTQKEIQQGYMMGSAAAVCGRFQNDKGRILVFSAHPETSGDDLNALLVHSFRHVVSE